MASGFWKFWKGIRLIPGTTAASEKGDLEALSSGKLNYHNGTTVSPVVTEAHSATLTNKTLVAASNTITTAASGNLSSVELNAALAELQGSIDTSDTNLSNHLADATDAHDASAISFSAVGTIAATDAQTAIAEVATDAASALSTHESDTSTHGVTTVAGLTETQTFTNKTLTSPKINENVALTTTATKLNYLTSATGTTGTTSTNIVFSTSPTFTTAININGSIVFTNNNSTISFAAPPAFYDQDTGHTLVLDSVSSTSGQINYFKFNGAGSYTPNIYDFPDLGGTTRYVIAGSAGTGSAGQVLKMQGGVPTWASFSGGINYISSNPDAESDTSGYSTYADAAGTSPVDGTGGSPSSTITRTTSSPLRGSGSFLITKSAANRQGEGVSYAFTLDRADFAKPIAIEFDYEIASGTFASGDSSDIRVYVYDVTNSTLIQPAPYTIQGGGSSQHKYKGIFQSSASGTSYRLIFHIATTSASAWTFKFDNVYVGPDTAKVSYGAAVTDWTSFTPTSTWVSNATHTGQWRRVGDQMELRYLLSCSGAPTAANLSVDLPTGYSIDTTKILTTDGEMPVGEGAALNSATASYAGLLVKYFGTTALAVTIPQDSEPGSTHYLDQNNVSNTVPFSFGASDKVYLKASVPISGWSSNVSMSNDTDTRIVSATYSVGSTAVTSGDPIDFSTKAWDTHSAVTTGAAWKFTAPVSGYYDVNVSGCSRAAGTGNTLAIYKNGVSYSSLFSFAVAGMNFCGGSTVQMNAGDYIDVRLDGSVTIVPGILSINRRSGPAAIAATELVAVDARASTNQTITGGAGLTDVAFATEVVETHGSFSSPTFTAPVSGKYLVSCYLRFDTGGTATGQVNCQILKNASSIQFATLSDLANSKAYSVSGTRIYSLSAGDTIKIQISSSTQDITLQDDQCALSIARLGI